MVGLSGSGPSVFEFVLVGFGFLCRCRYLAGSVESRLDLDEISSDLVGSGGFHLNRSRKSKNIAGISHFLSEILRMSPDVVDLVVESGGSGFGGGNPPTDLKGSRFVGGDPQPTVRLVGSGGGRSVSGDLQLLPLQSMPRHN